MQAMSNQCELEIEVRCFSGLSDKEDKVDCPITIMEDNSKRKSAWSSLKSKVQKRDPVIDNANWNHDPRKAACTYDKSAVNKGVWISNQ